MRRKVRPWKLEEMEEEEEEEEEEEGLERGGE